MTLSFLKSKIHRVTVTEANLHYEGSITIDSVLMEAANIRPFEKVHVYNVSNGERFATYAIPGKKGVICLNGAAAWKGKEKDIVIIATYCQVTEEEARSFSPTVVLVNQANEIKTVSNYG